MNSIDSRKCPCRSGKDTVSFSERQKEGRQRIRADTLAADRGGTVKPYLTITFLPLMM